jgi:hypothetical protein
MKIIKHYLEFLQRNREFFAVDSFPKETKIKKKKRAIVSEQNKKK